MTDPWADRPHQPEPPPNRTICTACGQENCTGHPVYATVVILAFIIIPVVIGLARFGF